MKNCIDVTVRATQLPVAMPPMALMHTWSDNTNNNESTQFPIIADHQLGQHPGLSWTSCDLVYWCPSQHHSYWCRRAWHLRWVPHTAELRLLTGSDHRCYHQGWLARHQRLYTHSTVHHGINYCMTCVNSIRSHSVSPHKLMQLVDS